MPLTMRADTLEYATASITADHDITGKVIEVALPPTGTTPSAWVEADVVSVASVPGSKWKATYRVLIGPTGDFPLSAAGSSPAIYDWTVKLTDTPEIPVRKVDTVTITPV